MNLRATLAQLQSDAFAKPNLAAGVTMPNGLRVDLVYATENKKTVLKLSRPTTYPSQKEMQLVLRSMPNPPAAIYSHTEIQNKRYYLIVSWKAIQTGTCGHVLMEGVSNA